MKYSITENRLHNIIYEYIDNFFSDKEINFSHPYVIFDDGSEGEDEDLIEFYSGDYSEDDMLFRYYKCGYFTNHPKSDCPVLELERDYENELNRLFGEAWHIPFQEWFWKKFKLKVRKLN